MRFEWDPAKNEENIRKHFLDLSDAREIFEGPLLAVVDDRFDYGEPRITAIGILRNLVVVLIFTERNDDIIRIISLRRALKNERQNFYEYLQNRLGTPEDNA
jgi:uncharacterized DUF497 family protein